MILAFAKGAFYIAFNLFQIYNKSITDKTTIKYKILKYTFKKSEHYLSLRTYGYLTTINMK